MKNNKIKILQRIFLLLSTCIIIYLLLNPFIDNQDLIFIEKVNNNAISANILMITTIKEEHGTSSTGSSGVIFRKEDDKYYALTALHVLPLEEDLINIDIIVLGYNQPSYDEAKAYNSMSFTEYYSQSTKAVLEYYDVAYDLAVISFNSENEYAVLSIASEPPKYNESVAAIGNPHGHSRNNVTTGNILRKFPSLFGDKINKNSIFHSAKIYGGNSGGALLNNNLEIVGINLGAFTNIFHQFVRGTAMPCDRLLDFLYDMDNQP